MLLNGGIDLNEHRRSKQDHKHDIQLALALLPTHIGLTLSTCWVMQDRWLNSFGIVGSITAGQLTQSCMEVSVQCLSHVRQLWHV